MALNPVLWWTLAGLILTNLDEDHVDDFEATLKNLRVATVCINNTIDATGLKIIKRDGMAAGITAVHDYLQNPSCLNLLLDVPQITVSLFRFPLGAFNDTNNLSLMTFIEYGRFCILYPGDLEEAGRKALMISDFRTILQRVNLFVTSRDGRENGCCAELLNSAFPTRTFSLSPTKKWFTIHRRRQRGIDSTQRGCIRF